MVTSKAARRSSAAAAPRKPASSRSDAVYFLSLSVEDVRCFGASQILDLSDGHGNPRQWTIILGNNGIGKTTLLQSLFFASPVLVSTYPAFDREWGPRGLESTGIPINENDLIRHSARRGVLRLKVACGEHLSLASPRFTIHEQELELQLGGAEWNPIEAPSDMVCFGYGAARRMGSGALTQERKDDAAASLFADDAPLRNAEEWLLQTDYAASKPSPEQKEAQRRRDEVVAMLVDLLPEVDEIRFFADVEGRPSSPRPGVRVKTPYGWVPLRSLSLGYKTLLAWMVDLASRLYEAYPKSKTPLHEPAVVLVDEIDLHLHPTWQRKLIGYLTERFPNVQFIVTAHSPLVVQSAPDANVVVLRRDGDQVIIDNDPENVRGWRVDQIYTSDLFGLPSARPPELDDALDRRDRLLAKKKLTAKEREELAGLERTIGHLSFGETPEDIRAMDIIRRAAPKMAAGKKR